MSYNSYKIEKTGGMVAPIVVHTSYPKNWQYFFNQPVMTPESLGNVDRVITVRSASVRRGPGDPNPYTRRGGERFYVRYDKKKGSARPGQTFKVGELNPMGSGYRQLRQFAISGDLMDVWAYAHAKAKFQLTLWGPNGWWEEIDAAAGGGAVALSGLALLTDANGVKLSQQTPAVQPTAAPVAP